MFLVNRGTSTSKNRPLGFAKQILYQRFKSYNKKQCWMVIKSGVAKRRGQQNLIVLLHIMMMIEQNVKLVKDCALP
jgi:hypothetical protein